MIRKRLGLKALGLCVLAMGVMAFGASAAQAAEWDVSGAAIGASLLPEIQINEILPLPAGSLEPGNRHVSLLIPLTASLTIEILCAKAEGVGIKLGQGGKVDPGKVDFSECITNDIKEGVKTKLGACTPNAEGKHPGLIITKEGKGQLETVEGTKVTVLKPVTGELLATIELGAECSVAEEVEVKGQLALKDSSGVEVSQAKHMIEEGPGTNLTALGKKATIDGSAGVVLVGAHNGLSWNGLLP